MPYTVKQVAGMSGVSVRALHFYDETGLLKPANVGANGYRFYDEAQLLRLQQILFYRELGFELKQIKRILSQRDFEIIAALESHRKVLEENLRRTRTLIETIGKTIQHLKGKKKMKTEEMFVGFSVAAGDDRFGEHLKLGGAEPVDCKVSGQDTDGAICAFEVSGSSGPRHLHDDLNEWVYIVEGDFVFEVGEKRLRAGAGESVFIPREVPHIWGPSNGSGKVINVYQPAGKMENFFREVGKFSGAPAIHEAMSLQELKQLFEDHGMRLLRQPPECPFEVNAAGRIVRKGP